MQDNRSVGYSPGWYPDPVGVHDLRYHNGETWTGDVSTDGERHVSPLPTVAEPEPSGTSAFVLGIISLCIGWIPFVSVVGIGTSLAAIVIGLRRRRFASARNAANTGVVMGGVGLALAALGTWLAVVIVDAVARWDDPGPHEIELVTCEEVGGVTQATGTITNLDDGSRSYTIEVTFDGDRSGAIEVDDVAAGTTVSFVIEEDFRFDALNCEITAVNGPRPFGLDTGT